MMMRGSAIAGAFVVLLLAIAGSGYVTYENNREVARLSREGRALAELAGRKASGNKVTIQRLRPKVLRNTRVIARTRLINGQKGSLGDPGPFGKRGAQGVGGRRGPVGAAGKPGQPGAAGEVGAPGRNGVKGEPGAQGERGSQGEPGGLGPAGSQGAPGSPCPTVRTITTFADGPVAVCVPG